MASNQNPEHLARDNIDALLKATGWSVQDKNRFDPNDGSGQAVREYPTESGPADYVLFVDRMAVGVIEAKRESRGENLTVVEEQTDSYANAKLKWISNTEPLPFLYESTGVITRFTDRRDPKPLSRLISPGRWYRWPPARARPTRPSPPYTGFSSTPKASVSCFSSIQGTWENRLSRRCSPSPPVTITASSPNFMRCSA